MTEFTLNEELAQRLLTVVDAGLSDGLGRPSPGEMCVEAAIGYACGMPFGDRPTCVGSSVRQLSVELNDETFWNDEKSRAAGMRRLAVAQLGSNTINQIDFVRKVTVRLITKVLPKSLRGLSRLLTDSVKVTVLHTAAESLEQASEDLDQLRRQLKQTRKTIEALFDISDDSIYNGEGDADAKTVATGLGELHFARESVHAAIKSTPAFVDQYLLAAVTNLEGAVDFLGQASPDGEQFICEMVEHVVQVLIELKSPGCEYLYLTETKGEPVEPVTS